MRQWAPEQRAARAEQCRRDRPWLKSTGPKTAAGKTRSARNAYKHGMRSDGCRRIRAWLRLQRHFIRNLASGGDALLLARRFSCDARKLLLKTYERTDSPSTLKQYSFSGPVAENPATTPS